MKYIKLFLQFWGGASIVVGVVLAVAFWSEMKTMPREMQADREDVIFVFNQTGLASNQAFSIVTSFDDHRHYSDYLEYYCLELDEPLVTENLNENWVSVSDVGILAKVRNVAARNGDIEACFGAGLIGNDSSLIVFQLSADLLQRAVRGARMVFYHPPSNRLLYVGYQT